MDFLSSSSLSIGVHVNLFNYSFYCFSHNATPEEAISMIIYISILVIIELSRDRSRATFFINIIYNENFWKEGAQWWWNENNIEQTEQDYQNKRVIKRSYINLPFVGFSTIIVNEGFLLPSPSSVSLLALSSLSDGFNCKDKISC